MRCEPEGEGIRRRKAVGDFRDEDEQQQQQEEGTVAVELGAAVSFWGAIQRLRVSEKHRKKKRLWLMAQNVRSWQRQHASPAKREK